MGRRKRRWKEEEEMGRRKRRWKEEEEMGGGRGDGEESKDIVAHISGPELTLKGPFHYSTCTWVSSPSSQHWSCI